jgi:hypothetical protein
MHQSQRDLAAAGPGVCTITDWRRCGAKCWEVVRASPLGQRLCFQLACKYAMHRCARQQRTLAQTGGASPSTQNRSGCQHATPPYTRLRQFVFCHPPHDSWTARTLQRRAPAAARANQQTTPQPHGPCKRHQEARPPQWLPNQWQATLQNRNAAAPNLAGCHPATHHQAAAHQLHPWQYPLAPPIYLQAAGSCMHAWRLQAAGAASALKAQATMMMHTGGSCTFPRAGCGVRWWRSGARWPALGARRHTCSRAPACPALRFLQRPARWELDEA